MDALWIEVLKVVGAALGFGSAGFLAYSKIKESKLTKELKLSENPERCGQHQAKLERLREDLDSLEENNTNEHREMLRQIGGISLELVKIGKDIEACKKG